MSFKTLYLNNKQKIKEKVGLLLLIIFKYNNPLNSRASLLFFLFLFVYVDSFDGGFRVMIQMLLQGSFRNNLYMFTFMFVYLFVISHQSFSLNHLSHRLEIVIINSYTSALKHYQLLHMFT